MNFNDVKERLEKTLASFNARYDPNVLKSINITFENTDAGHSTTVKFGNDDPQTITNKIFIILYNLSSLKDHLKNCLKNNGHDPNIVEQEINNSIHLQVLIDLVNQEKHGYPLTKSNRSGKNPLIKNPSQFLLLRTDTTAGSTASFTFSRNGPILHGNNSIMIDAEIHDDKGNLLFLLDELIDTCFSKWNQIATTYKCI